MLRILTVLLAFASALALPNQTPLRMEDNIVVTDCGTDTDSFKLTKIEATPYPPRAGENVTIYAVGTVFQPISESAIVDITVKLGAIKLAQKRVNICEQVVQAGERECPLEKGEYTISQTVTIPGIAPMGRYRIEARGYTSEDAEEVDLSCLNLQLRLLPIRPHFG